MAEKEISEWARKCKERSPNRSHGFTTGEKPIPTYTAWKNMKARCGNPKRPDFERYGGRGIVVCQRWRESFESFFADMGMKPSPQYTIERTDTNGNYEPANCVWATQVEQQNNKRTNVIIEFGGKQQTMAQWAREKGMSLALLHNRIKSGWDIPSALTTPAHALIEFDGRRKTMAEWARSVGIKQGTLWYRIKSGWSIAEALTPIPDAPA